MGQVFSVEMRPKRHVRGISICDEAHDRALFESDLGDLEDVVFGGSMLEVRGSYGVHRVELTRGETERLMSQKGGICA